MLKSIDQEIIRLECTVNMLLKNVKITNGRWTWKLKMIKLELSFLIVINYIDFFFVWVEVLEFTWYKLVILISVSTLAFIKIIPPY